MNPNPKLIRLTLDTPKSFDLPSESEPSFTVNPDPDPIIEQPLCLRIHLTAFRRYSGNEHGGTWRARSCRGVASPAPSSRPSCARPASCAVRRPRRHASG